MSGLQALGDEAAAMQHRAQALQVMQNVQADIERSDATVRKKFTALQALLSPAGQE